MSNETTFECERCGVLQLPRARHPKWSSQWVGHCDWCCEHSAELYANEGFYGRDEYVCSNCCEAAHEASLSDYYGGSGPVTVDEQCRAAYAAKQGAK